MAWTAEHDVNGLHFMVSVALLVASFYILPSISRAYRQGRAKGLGIYQAIEHRYVRVRVGVVLIFAGVFLRTAPWFPWRAMLAAGDYATAYDYAAWSYLWVLPGSIAIMAGTAMVMWDVFAYRISRLWGIPFALVASAVLFGIGVGLTELLAMHWSG